MVDIARETVVSLDDVARRLDVDIRTVRNWAKRKQGRRLATGKFGGKVVTTLEAVKRFQVSNDLPPSAKPKKIRSLTDEEAARRLRDVHRI